MFLFVCATGVASTAGTPGTSGPAVEGIEVSGPGVVDGTDSRPLIAAWKQTTVTVTLTPERTSREVCLSANTSADAVGLGCREPAGSGAVSVEVDRWPANLSGRVTLVARSPGTDGRAERLVSLLAAEDDRDNDGLTNRAELEAGTDPTRTDTDGDGLEDGAETNTYGTDPTARDTDGDDLADGLEVDQYGSDPAEGDTDGDGLDDGEEITIYGTNPTAVDTDGDSLDDGAEVDDHGTDSTEADTDGDGLVDGPEVGQYGTDPTRANAEVTGDTSGESGIGSPLPVPASWSVLLGVALAGTLVGTVVAVVALRLRADASSTAAAEPVADPTAHPDEERVRRLLAEHDGRLPQSAIVERTGWSKSKVSRVLSSMAQDDEVEKIRVGRENLVVLPGAEPEYAKSPFEE